MKKYKKFIVVLCIALIISQSFYNKSEALPIAVPAGAVIVIGGGLIVAGCYSNDHESMTNMIEYTWNNISTEMQQEAVRLSLYKDTGVIITQSLLSAIGNAITQRFGAAEGAVTEAGPLQPVQSGYTFPEQGVSQIVDTYGNVYHAAIIDEQHIETYKNGVMVNGQSHSYTEYAFNYAAVKVVGDGMCLVYTMLNKTTGVTGSYTTTARHCYIQGSVASVSSDTTWSWDLDANRGEKEPKRIPLPPGGIPDVASDADDWAWNNTDGKTSDSIDSPVTGDDVTADTSGIAGAVRSIRNLVSSIADFFNPNVQPTLNMEPLKVSVDLFTTRFPFSLPWDFLRAFTSMQSEGSWEPKFNVTMPAGLPVGDLFDFEIDLTMWQDAADLARKLELLAFDIGLILLTRKLLGGGV